MVTQRIQRLLDESPLKGVQGIERKLGPIRRAMAVSRSDQADVADLVGRICQQWGGARHLIVPEPQEGGTQFQAPWHELLLDSVIDQVGGPESIDEDPYELPEMQVSWYTSTLLTMLTYSGNSRDEWHPVVVPVVEPDNPWFFSYLGTCGVWPEAPHTEAFRYMNLREDVSFDDFIETSWEQVEVPGPEDLLRRLRDARSVHPREATMFLLARRRWVTHITGGGDSVLPRRHAVADRVGPNVVVVYEPDSVEDLCLLWNLGASSDHTLGFPLAVPNIEGVADSIEYWMAERCWNDLDGTGPHLALTSFSVGSNHLSSIAEVLRQDWAVVEPAELLVGSDRAFRASSDVVTFDQGRSRVAAWHPADRSEIGYSGQSMAHQLRTRINLESERLPRSRSLRGEKFSGSSMFVDGGADFAAQDPEHLLTVTWPTGWEVVKALAQDRGLAVRPSIPGAAATALVRRLGSIESIEGLVSEPLIAYLTRLSERQGTSYFKKRVREIAEAVAKEGQGEAPNGAMQAILDRLRKVEGPSDDDDPRAITVENMRPTFGGNRAITERWMMWAEGRQLLVRGGSVRCNQCGASRWRSIRDLAPPINCSGCGAVIDQPFRADQLIFRYILGEPLRRAFDLDAIPHVLAMRYFLSVFRSSFGRPSYLYGAYPGVEFLDPQTSQVVGEADVLLVFTDGELVPGECKLHASGLTTAELEKFNDLALKLKSPWSFVATPDYSNEASAWKSARRVLPEAPRLVLTGEHLFKSAHDVIVDDHPFVWQEMTAEARAENHESFLKDLPRLLDYLEVQMG